MSSIKDRAKALVEDAPFRSWLMGGFEGASMQFGDGRRVDVIARSGHDVRAEQDYRLLADIGILTVRDSLRWHSVERTPGQYDWSSFLPMLRAAQRVGTQVLWGLCHFGLPEGIDPWSAELVDRFAAFARAAARVVANETDAVPFWCPVNEISYWAFAGGERRHFLPAGHKRGREWKRQLARLVIAGTKAVLEVDPRARIIHTDPVIHVASNRVSGVRSPRAERDRLSMFEGWDMIGGRLAPDLGGTRDLLDMIGVNFYANNQWVRNGRRLHPGDLRYRPLHQILQEVAERYDRPVLISETGAEGRAGPVWHAQIMQDLRLAAALGTTVQGLCLYPIMDYPGWTNDRHCRCGVITVADDWTKRDVDPTMLEALKSPF